MMPKCRSKCKSRYYGVFNLTLCVLYTNMQWKCLLAPKDGDGNPEIHYTTIYRAFTKWTDDGSISTAFAPAFRTESARSQRPGMALGPTPSLRKETIALAMLLPDELKGLKRVANLTKLKFNYSYLNLNGRCDSRSNR